jgi:hypothetical protein
MDQLWYKVKSLNKEWESSERKEREDHEQEV